MLGRGATDLAYVCWQETTKRLEPGLEEELRALKNAVQSSRYQKLEEELKNQRWNPDRRQQ